MSRRLIHGTFKHQEKNEEDDLYSPCLTPLRTSRKTSPCSTPTKRSSKTTTTSTKDSKNNNPYATRGRDKFSALLAELEEKKQKIYSQKDSEKIAMVRFVYSSSSNDIVPIVIKAKDKSEAKGQEDIIKQSQSSRPTTPKSVTYDNKYPIESSTRVNKEIKEPSLESEKRTKKINLSWKIILGNLSHPSYYVPAVVILILVLLTVFGRSVAILITSIGWYMVPTITGDTLKAKKRPRRKTDHTRRLSDNNIATDGLKRKEFVTKVNDIKVVVCDGLASPRRDSINNVAAAAKNDSPLKHIHRKSW